MGSRLTKNLYPQVSPYVVDRAVEVVFTDVLPPRFPSQTVASYVVPTGKMAVLQYVYISPVQTTSMAQLAGGVNVNRTGTARVIAAALSVTSAVPRQDFAGHIGLILMAGNEVTLTARNSDSAARALAICAFIDEIDL